jgi:hypothetical protein
MTPCHSIGAEQFAAHLAAVTASRDELLAALKDMREACAAAMRVMAVHEWETDAWLIECRRLGIEDGFGKRADEAIRKASNV